MVTHTLTILQNLLQDFYSVHDHFVNASRNRVECENFTP